MQNNMEKSHNKKRIEWIDMAKSIGILLMIIGHVYSTGTTVRNVIFSFHMPLFFVLSGYTFHFQKITVKEWIKSSWKDFRRLYCPAIIVWLINYIVCMILYHPQHFLANRLYALFWASGYENNAPYLGALWFLVSMFWARFIIRTFLLIFDSEKVTFICILLGSLESIHALQRKLPQNFNVTMMAVMFISIGHIGKKYESLLKKYCYILIFCGATFWSFCLSQGLYIELAVRKYPYGMLSCAEALCGIALCVGVSVTLCSNKVIKRPFLFLGRHTLLLLCIHCLDGFWKSLWQISSKLYTVSVARIIVDLLIMNIILLIEVLFRRSFSDMSAWKKT